MTSLRLVAPADGALPAPLPGQYLTVRLALDSGQTIVRNYSLSGPPGGREYRISVKREPHGLGSGHVHESVRTGQTIDVAAPRGTFTLVPGARIVERAQGRWAAFACASILTAIPIALSVLGYLEGELKSV